MVFAAALVRPPQHAARRGAHGHHHRRRRRRQGLGRDCTEPSFHDDLTGGGRLLANARRSGRPGPGLRRGNKAPAGQSSDGWGTWAVARRLRGADGADTLLAAAPRVNGRCNACTGFPSRYQRSELNVTLPFQLRRMRPMDDGCLRCISIEQQRPAEAASIYLHGGRAMGLGDRCADATFLRPLASDPERPTVMVLE